MQVRISERSHQDLKDLASKSGESMQDVLERAVESYRRQRLLEDANLAYARLKHDGTAWREELDERERWEATLADGREG